MQIFVSTAGIALLCALAYFRKWSQKIEKAPPRLAEDGKPAIRQVGPSILNRPPREKSAEAH
jgi:hypothetical protein